MWAMQEQTPSEEISSGNPMHIINRGPGLTPR
jgi:hypothetical protein